MAETVTFDERARRVTDGLRDSTNNVHAHCGTLHERIIKQIEEAVAASAGTRVLVLGETPIEGEAVVRTVHDPIVVPPCGAIAVVRPEVARFAALMEQELRANDHKRGWKGMSQFDLWGRAHQEMHELSAALADHRKLEMIPGARPPGVGGPVRTRPLSEAIAKVGHEAADAANFLMMIADVCGALGEPPRAA